MARPRTESFDQQRDHILQAAARLFAARGFAGTSMSQLAGACGVSKPLLYHYYRDKAQLLSGIVDGYMDRLLVIVAEVQAQGLEPPVRLRTLVGRFMREYQHSQAHHMVLVQDVKFLSAEDQARVADKQRTVVEAFARAIAGTRPRWTRRTLRVPLAMILFGMINWTFTWLRPDGSLTYDDMAEVVTEIFLHGIARPGPAPEGGA